MNQKNKSIIKIFSLHLIAIALISSLFFLYLSNEKEKYEIKKDQIEGLDLILQLDEIIIELQKIRGLGEIANNSKESNIISLANNDILNLHKDIKKHIKDIKRELKDTNKFLNKDILDIFDDIILTIDEKQKIAKDKQFEVFTVLIDELDGLYLKIVDTYNLKLKLEKDNYFLMMLTIYDLPQIQEDFAKVRGLGSMFISSNDLGVKNGTILKERLLNIEEKLFRVKNYISLLRNIDEAKTLNIQLKDLLADERKLSNMIDTIFYDKSSKDSSLEYFNECTEIINGINSFFIETHSLIDKSIKTKKTNLEKYKTYAWIIYLTSVLGTLLGAFYLSKRVLAEQEDLENKRVVKEFKEQIYQQNDLKGVCDIGISEVCRYLNASNGSVYIYHVQNFKLYLGSAFSRDEKKLKTIINLGEDDIGQVAKDKTKIRREQKNKDGFFEYTYPIIYQDKIVGIIDIQTLYKMKKSEEVLYAFFEIMGANIYDKTIQQRSNEMFEVLDENIITSQTNLSGIITFVSNAFAEISGYTKDEMIGKSHNIVRHPDMPDEVYDDLWKTIKGGDCWEGEIKNLKRDGGFYWVKANICPNYDLSNNIIGYTAVRQDITDKKFVEEISIKDSMTSLYNRRYFESNFDDFIIESKKQNKKFVFAMMDVDHFKQYNDTYGHQMGDETLKSVANVLKDVMEQNKGLAFRLGGEEFGVVFYEEEDNQISSILEQIKNNIEAQKIEHSGNSASKYVTISIGVYVIRDSLHGDLDEIYKDADDALYRAKEGGRNKIEFCTNKN